MLEASEGCLERRMTDDGLIGGRDEDAHHKQGFGIGGGSSEGRGDGC